MALNIKAWLQGIVGLLVTVVVLIVCLTYFSIGLATRSNPKPYGESNAPVADSVNVYRNTFGIPHIVGRNIADVLFAQGYVHAQDRLWQMDICRRIGRGRVAELLGKRAAGNDVFMRAIGIPTFVHKQIQQLDSTTIKLLNAYARGVSDFIQEHSEQLPFEFDALNYKPEPWTAEDCLIVERVLSFEQSLAFFNDVVYAQIAAQRGLNAMELYVSDNNRAPLVLDSATQVNSLLRNTDTLNPSLGAMFNVLGADVLEAREAFGMRGSSIGSNCWAVSKGPRRALLANDPHSSATMPPKWYQNHLTAGEFNVIGMSIPGIPLVLSGRNDSLAWGITSAMMDDVDYVIEHVDSTNPNYYFDADGSRVKFTFKRDTIKIKGQPDSLIDLRFTKRSCVLSDVHLLKEPSAVFGFPRRLSSRMLYDQCLTFRWTGAEYSNEIGSMFRINTAKSVEQALNALRMWGSPAYNFHFATTNGVVATTVAGIVPNRSVHSPLLPFDTRSSTSDWNGVVGLTSFGSTIKRGKGYVASANNQIIANQTDYISTLHEPSARAERIMQQLEVYSDISARDAQVMQADIVSTYALRFTQRLLPILNRAASRFNTVEKSALKAMKNWDGTMSAVDGIASLHAEYMQRMIWNTFEDELGTQLYYDWVYVGSNAMKLIEDAIEDPTNPLFDDVRTSTKEDLGWIAIRSFVEAVNAMQSRFESDNISDWKYGKMHSLSFPHLFGYHPLMKPVMNAGPFEMGGSSTTILSTEWSIYRPYNVTVVPSMRIVCDMADSVQYCVVPGGVSGQPLDAHYTDQLQLWLKGGYVRLPTSKRPDVSFRLFHVFRPAT